MKIAIMQPYFMPHLGYFQLMHAVDEFVLFDNVQFIKKGWINRNRILVNQTSSMFTIPLKKDSSSAKICERYISPGQWPRKREKILKMVRLAYRNAPFYSIAYPVIEECLTYNSELLCDFILHSLKQIQKYLGLTCSLSHSSELKLDPMLKGQRLLITICETFEAQQYINSIGGKDLYDRGPFERHGIELFFLQTKEVTYTQFKNGFIPQLSIIDVMMFNSATEIKRLLEKYELI